MVENPSDSSLHCRMTKKWRRGSPESCIGTSCLALSCSQSSTTWTGQTWYASQVCLANGLVVRLVDLLFARLGNRQAPSRALCDAERMVWSMQAYASVQLNADLGLSDYVYGVGSGIFFLGYMVFQVGNFLRLPFRTPPMCCKSCSVYGFSQKQGPSTVAESARVMGCVLGPGDEDASGIPNCLGSRQSPRPVSLPLSVVWRPCRYPRSWWRCAWACRTGSASSWWAGASPRRSWPA